MGNLTVGGTGKTPVVEKFARVLRDQGRNVAILSRGYRSKPTPLHRRMLNKVFLRDDTTPPRVVSDGKSLLLDSEMAGDEPYMLASNLKDVVVLVDKDRVKSGRYAIEKFGCDTLLLDDGFQYWKLRGRRLDIVLIDRQQPFGNERLLPHGTLREPPSHLARASAIFITKSDGNTEELRRRIAQLNPTAGIIECIHHPLYLEDVFTGQREGLELLKGRKVASLSGIAQPESFERSLVHLGAELVYSKRFADHHRFTQQEILNAINRSKKRQAETIVTTQKDAVRFPSWTGATCPSTSCASKSKSSAAATIFRTASARYALIDRWNWCFISARAALGLIRPCRSSGPRGWDVGSGGWSIGWTRVTGAWRGAIWTSASGRENPCGNPRPGARKLPAHRREFRLRRKDRLDEPGRTPSPYRVCLPATPSPPPGQAPRRMVAAIGHFGNFELYARVGQFAPAYRSATTYRGLRQPSLNRLLQALRRRSGCLFFERRSEGSALKVFMRQPAVVLGLLSDQASGPNGLQLPFLGHECWTSPAPAVFALRYDCGLLRGLLPCRLARWRIEADQEIPTHQDGQARPLAAIMGDVNRAFEAAVRRDPANWFWVHNRWKTRRPKTEGNPKEKPKSEIRRKSEIRNPNPKSEIRRPKTEEAPML